VTFPQGADPVVTVTGDAVPSLPPMRTAVTGFPRRPVADSTSGRRRAAVLASLVSLAVVAQGLVFAGVATARSGGPTGRVERAQVGQAAPAPSAAAPSASAPVSAPAAATPQAAAGELQPGIQYEDAMAHANDRIAFTPGDRVSVGFSPRGGDTWPVAGHAPRSLPAGNATGREMVDSPQGSRWAVRAPSLIDGAGSLSPVDGPTVDPATVQQANGASAVAPSTFAAGSPQNAGLLRQVFGFLPYWQVSDPSTTLSYDVLSTIAYFSVGANAAGNLLKRNADGTPTTGWAGWTSSRMTSVINTAHQRRTRVVLTISVFAWTSGQAAKQGALLGSPAARLNLARQAAAAVRDRGADGINLDFEPIAAGYADEFTAFVRTLRAELNRIAPGYQLTFDTTGWIGNYPLEGATASGAADAIFIMGYDYRTGGASTAGSIAPLTGPAYDITDTVRAYMARVPASKLILGVPYYGRAWSTSSDAVRASNISGTKYGASTSVIYTTAADYAATYGRRWDSIEQSPYVVYRRQNCTSTYGCVTAWRQIYYDDIASLGAKYDLINRYALRGVGMWALGYDGTRTELNTLLAAKFLHDTTAPLVGIKTMNWRQRDAGFRVSWNGEDISGITAYDIQVSADGGAWSPWLTGTTQTSEIFSGIAGHGYAFRARGRDGKGNVSAWNATSLWQTKPPMAVGGFGVIRVDGVATRTAPSTAAARVGTLNAADIVSVVGGPRTANGYTWWQVSGPLREWRAVSPIDEGVWVAAGPTSAPWMTLAHAPNTTLADAILRDFMVGDSLSRAFSPDGDGQRDTIRLSWTNALALDTLLLKVFRPDGSLVDTVSLPDRAVGAQTYDWNGIVGGHAVPDGSYMLALSGTIGTGTYSAPSSSPITPAQLAAFGVTVDTVAPTLTGSSISSAAFSPNGDGSLDTIRVSLSAAGLAGWGFAAAPLAGSTPGAPIATASGTGAVAAWAWNGHASGGAVAPDGSYRLTLWGADAAGNRVTKTWDVTLDTRRPALVSSVTPAIFSPNGDATWETTTLGWSSDEAASGTARIFRGTTTYRSWTVGSSGSIVWNGRTAGGTALADGRYKFRIDLVDAAGNRSAVDLSVVIDRTASRLAWSPGIFFPQDGDTYAATSRLSFSLTRTATTTLKIYDRAGNYVRTAWSGRSLGAGTWSWTWDGRATDGTYVARGWYRAMLTATSSLGTMTLTRLVLADAFSVVASPLTPSAGETLTLTLRTAEPLAAAPSVTFRQTGRSAVTRTATWLGGASYRVSFAVLAGSGPASVTIAARDAAGHAVSQLVVLAVP
jgi:spore germination protein YaaH/flagellar hook assembly protein FlgD